MLIVGNWKAYVETSADAKKLLRAAERLVSKKHELVLAPPAPFLGLLASEGRLRIKFAAQDISVAPGGPATGEVTAAIAAGAGATYAILGHSERRALGETDAVILAKVKQALAHGLTPIVCVGERERDAEAKYLGGLRTQLAAVFEPLSQKERLAVVVAYEPIWAIGKSAEDAITPTDLDEMVLYLRKLLSTYLPGKGNTKIRILYGGSTEPTNAHALATGTGIDGFLVGHASANVSMFNGLVKAVS